jgi:hypothetical protein
MNGWSGSAGIRGTSMAAKDGFCASAAGVRRKIGVPASGSGIAVNGSPAPYPSCTSNRPPPGIGPVQAEYIREYLGAVLPDMRGRPADCEGLGTTHPRRQAALQFVEASGPSQHLANDQKRPTVAEDLGGLGDRAVLCVAAHRATMLAANRPQVCYSNRLVRK